MIRTITLKDEMSFLEALQCLQEGKCIGIRPGNNNNFIVKYKPHWMNPDSPDFILCWNRSVKDGKGSEAIRTNSYLEKWFLVVIDTNSLPDEIALQFVLEDISKLV